jgi:hypothetical protein
VDLACSRSIRFVLAGVLFAAAAGLLWYGVARSAPPTRSTAPPTQGAAPPSPVSTASGAERTAIAAYLARLGRIDAAVETSERRGWRIIHAHGPGVRGVPPWGQRLVRQAVGVYAGAAARVRAVRPVRGFATAQRELGDGYAATSRVYGDVARLIANRQSARDPSALVADLERVAAALQEQKRLVIATRDAFRSAARRAGVPTPAWVAGLAYGSWRHG